VYVANAQLQVLQLKPGDVALDTGAGTGLSYGLLRQAVGPGGRILAFEQSPEMFIQAQDRVRREAWPNVWHKLSRAEDIELPQVSDAVLFNYVHDVSRTPEAIANI
jgi:arsenite methyltransferase